MLDIKDFQTLTRYTDSKILMLVIDGLGGLPHLQSAKTELESANIPNLDKLTHESTTGVAIPIQHGITPGSGPGHMSLFGYNPIKYVIGRGVLEAVGSGIKLANKDIAIRGNFCTINNQGMITDRRAGRISDNNATKLIKRLSQIKIDGIDITIKHLISHRFVLVLSPVIYLQLVIPSTLSMFMLTLILMSLEAIPLVFIERFTPGAIMPPL